MILLPILGVVLLYFLLGMCVAGYFISLENEKEIDLNHIPDDLEVGTVFFVVFAWPLLILLFIPLMIAKSFQVERKKNEKKNKNKEIKK